MKKVNCRNEKEVIGIKWIARVIDFGVSLTVIEALNDGLNAFLAVRENKKVYRQKVKQLANEAEKKMSLKKIAILSEMKDKKFFDTYSDAVIDIAEKDVQDFRSSIKKVLDENNVHDSDMIADVETARVMFVLATIHYNSVMEAAKSKFGNFHKELFNHFDLTDIRQTWERLCHLIYAKQTADLNTESVQEKYDQMSEKFVNGVYVSECVKEAKKACPYVYEKIKSDDLVNWNTFCNFAENFQYDALALEPIGKHEEYLGRRTKRGLFCSSIGKLINADQNGALNIMRKVVGDSYVSRIVNSGHSLCPVRYSNPFVRIV